ncbi:MAG: hypothetical protein ACHQAY_19560 [Hyphomicrobiales bacterium]
MTEPAMLAPTPNSKRDAIMKPCMSCAFYKKEASAPDAKNGFCHRYPPAVFLMGEEFRTLFPPVREDFACGEHEQARKTKMRA